MCKLLFTTVRELGRLWTILNDMGHCSQANLNSTLIPNDIEEWFGLELTPTLDRFLDLYIRLTITLTFDAIVRYRQGHHCLSLSVDFNVHLVENLFPILFESFALENINDDTYKFNIVDYQKADYPWTNIKFDGWPDLRRWFFLPDYFNPPSATLLIADFFQLLFACQQWCVFKYEMNEKDHVYVKDGGSNLEIIHDDKDIYQDNPTWDFVTNKRHWLNHIKYIIFMYGIWTILPIMYLAGITRVSLISIGYFAAYFSFFWYGQKILAGRVTIMLRIWNFLICFCYLAIFTNAFFQAAADIRFFMDGFCLIILLLQKRIFGSYYWKHIVTELRSQAKLASQSALLFEGLSDKRKEEKRILERKTVSRIHKTLDRIEKQQLKQNRLTTSATVRSDTSGHFETMRSGDYFIFDYESDEEEDEGKEDEATVPLEQILRVLTASATAAAADPEKETKQTGKSVLIKMCLIGRIMMEYLIDVFNRNSRDYRVVSRRLSEMKSEDKIYQQEERIRGQRTVTTASVVNLDEKARIDQSNRPTRTRTLSQPVDSYKFSCLYRLFDSLYYFTMSHSELLCYSAMIINHLTSGTLASMLLPLSIFLWATLLPRSSRIYWISVSCYIQMIILAKYISQWRFSLWNTSENTETNSSSAINILGIDGKENVALVADLFLLLTLFLHHSIFKQFGLWKAQTKTSDDSVDKDGVPTTQSDSFFVNSIIRFYEHLQFKQEIFVRDDYPSMFMCDFINMIIFIVFYSQFDERTYVNFFQTFRDNRVPLSFVLLLLIQFILIIIDRALYLRRNVYGKLFFQLLQVILVHIWLFFLLPTITDRKFRDNVAAKLWYAFKCIYFGYSSIQVRLGYPKYVSENYLMKHFNSLNQYCYRLYKLIPFLFELRSVMNWVFTNTTLHLPNWLQLEDIYSNVYLLKCTRLAQKKYPTKRGLPQPKSKKYNLGGCLLITLIIVIWFPLVFFSITSSFYQPNSPKEVNVEIRLGGYLPIYQMIAQNIDLKEFKPDDSRKLHEKINSLSIPPTLKDSANAFLRDFNPGDIRCVNLVATSVDLWKISQPIRDIVVNNLRSDVTVPVRFSYTITRNPLNQDNSNNIAAVVTGENTVDITTNNRTIRNALIQILNGTVDSQISTTFTIKDLMPRFLHVKSKAKPEEIDVFKKIFSRDYYANITMRLNRTKTIPNSTDVWWEMSEHKNKYDFIPSCDLHNQEYLSMMFFNDKVSPANISFLTRYGIIGLYTTFVIVVARLLRATFPTSQTVMFNEVPNVERLWRLLRAIDLVRENKLLRSEEELFAKLLFVYRSPETFIRFTKLKLD